MKKYLLIFGLLLASCTKPIYTESQSESLSQGVYATKDSIVAERHDLASKYIEETIRLVVPPKKRISIKPLVTKSGKKIALLPENTKGEIVIVESKEYKELVDKNKELVDLVSKSSIDLKNFEENISKELRKREDDLKTLKNDLIKAREEAAGNRGYKYTVLIGGTILILGLVGWIVFTVAKKFSLFGLVR